MSVDSEGGFFDWISTMLICKFAKTIMRSRDRERELMEIKWHFSCICLTFIPHVHHVEVIQWRMHVCDRLIYMCIICNSNSPNPNSWRSSDRQQRSRRCWKVFGQSRIDRHGSLRKRVKLRNVGYFWIVTQAWGVFVFVEIVFSRPIQTQNTHETRSA